MILMKDLVKKGNANLSKVSKKVDLKLSEENINLINDLMQYLVFSQNDELAKEYSLRPAVGIAAPQVGVNLRIFAVLDKDTQFSYVFINPEIISKSKELIYLDNGEGCLSVDEVYPGVVLRHSSITIKSNIYDFKLKKLKSVTLKLEGYPSIVFQHEYDHLDGILYTDKLVNIEDVSGAISFSEYEERF